MSREQFFKPINKQEEPMAEELVIPEKPTDWEIIKAQHLAAKEAFHKARAEARKTSKERYQDKKYGKRLENSDKPQM